MWWMRARAFKPYFFSAAAETISIAAAASPVWLDTPAVMLPPGASGSSFCICSSVESRVVSSCSRPLVTMISFLKRPSAIAARARRWLSSENCSISSREMFHLSAIICAPTNCDTGWLPKRLTQPSLPEKGSLKPSGFAQTIADEIGICVMVCTPPAMTTSCVPLITAWAAKCTACCELPHWRSMVTPGTCNGSPAASQLVRAMLPASGPMASRQPKMTSS